LQYEYLCNVLKRRLDNSSTSRKMLSVCPAVYDVYDFEKIFLQMKTQWGCRHKIFKCVRLSSYKTNFSIMKGHLIFKVFISGVVYLGVLKILILKIIVLPTEAR